MESLLFAGAVFGMLWLCFIIYNSDKNKRNESDLGIFSFKSKKDTLAKVSLKK